MRMKWNALHKESCPVARGLSVVGDRWTILVLRDCFLGIRRFEQIHERLGITRHILADRLRKLETAGVLRREPYQRRPLRHQYHLTEQGKALYPLIVTLIEWANTNVPHAGEPSVTLVSRATGTPISPVLIDANTGTEITHQTVTAMMAE